MFNTRCFKRPFSTSTPLLLLYKRATKLKKIDPPQPTLPPSADVPQRYAKYYAKCPSLLKPHMREMLTHPAGFVLSIAALQQLATLLPFLALWYTLYKSGGPEVSFLPEHLLERGTTLMDRALSQTTVSNELSPEQTAAAVRSGATAYAAVSASSPLVWATSLFLAPAFKRSIERTFSVLKKRFSR